MKTSSNKKKISVNYFTFLHFRNEQLEILSTETVPTFDYDDEVQKAVLLPPIHLLSIQNPTKHVAQMVWNPIHISILKNQ